MLLQELLGVKKFKGMTPREIARHFEAAFDNGETVLRLIGGGGHARVFSDGKDIYKFWLRDSAYDAFVSYVAKNQNNPFLPKLKSKPKSMPAFFQKVEGMPDRVQWVKLEMLDRNASGLFPYKFESASFNLIPFLTYFMNMGDLTDTEIVKELERLRDLDSEFFNAPASKPLPSEVVLLAKTGCEIGLLCEGKHENDLFEGNVMKRNGFPVILDPIANRTDYNFNLKLEKLFIQLERSKAMPD